MSELSKGMRHRRFNLVKDSPVRCVIETNTGTRLTLSVRNASLSGIGGETSEEVVNDESLAIGSIIAAGKLTFEGHEYALGRLVVRTYKQDEGKLFIGFSTVDSKVPVDGSLSRYLEESVDVDSVYDYELSADRFSIANFREGSDSNVDLFAKTKKYGIFFREWEKTDRFGSSNVRTASMGPRSNLTARRKNGRHDFLIMGSNDYLGMASNPEVLRAAHESLDKYGFGSTGSPLTTGITDLHLELCNMLAQMFRKEKVILFNSGYAANLGTISGLIQAQDLVVADMIAHASIQDGMELCQGTSRFFKHNNPQHLNEMLGELRKNHAGALVITEGVFSMDGDVPPLTQIYDVARANKCRIMVDEAHSLGVIGPRGLGACEKFGLTDKVDIIMGTFSKIGGAIGGFIADGCGYRRLDWLASTRAHVFG